MFDTIILGGGLTGVSLAHQLDGKNLVLEKDECVGGLCRTFSKDSFFYDIGGHIIFSKDKQVLDFMVDALSENVDRLYRNNKVYLKGRYIKYPFENDLHALEKKDTLRCLYYFLKNDYPLPKNFREWIYHRFGKGIGELYLEPYNNKIWKHPLEDMALGWVERVPRPPKIDVIKSSLGIKTEGYKHQLYFYYPKKGGIQFLVESLKEKCSENCLFELNRKVESIRKVDGVWEVYDGVETHKCGQLISTIPLQNLVELVGETPPEVREAVSKLVYNRMYVVLVGLNKEIVSDKSALYVPSEDIIFHRVIFNKYFGSNYVPKSKSALTAEITFPPKSDMESMSDEDVVKKVVEGLEQMGLISEDDVSVTDVKRIEYAYVVYDKEYEKNIKLVRDYFSSQGIYLCGRFSEFEYLNMDACIRHAMDLASKLNEK